MTKTLDEILILLSSMCDKDVIRSKDFGIEFGTYAEKVTKSTKVKTIFVSTFADLRLTHSMIENKSNLAITIMPLSIIENSFPLSERDFELLRSLTTNNIKTISLSNNWLYSQNGAFAYFLQTLGINQFKQDKVSLSPGNNVFRWNTNGLSFKDFLANLSHLTKKWTAFNNASEDKPECFVLEKQELSLKELERLRTEGITTVISFNLDSKRLKGYKQNKMNLLFIPIQDFCNIALRKFSQLLQMKVEQKVIFYPHKIEDWISANDLTN